LEHRLASLDIQKNNEVEAAKKEYEQSLVNYTSKLELIEKN